MICPKNTVNYFDDAERIDLLLRNKTPRLPSTATPLKYSVGLQWTVSVFWSILYQRGVITYPFPTSHLFICFYERGITPCQWSVVGSRCI